MENIDKLKGIGPKTLDLLSKLDIKTVEDLQTYYPFRYEVLVKTSLDSDKVIVDGIISSMPRIFYFNYKKNKMTFTCNVENKLINLVIFNRAFLKNNLFIGNTITMIGKYDQKTNTLTASDILLKPLPDIPKIEPIYHLTANLKQAQLRKLIASSLSIKASSVLPNYLEAKYKFMSYKDSLSHAHFPKTLEYLKKSHARLIYEELFLFMFKMNYLKLTKTKNIGIKRSVSFEEVQSFIENLPFELTSDQLSSVNDIYIDLNSQYSMNRMLQGDVGSGKTIVSIISMYINHLSGHMSALMVPTEVLATQHYINVNRLLEPFNIKVALLTGKMKKSEKDKVKKEILMGNIDIIIGTHSLITDDLDYHNLGLVITDEQHRFGVNQRSAFKNKGKSPDILYMSATPIPRTYALTLYGDMEISNIKTMPSGRKEIKTIIKNDKDVKEVLELMLKELKNKHQIYVIAPLIEENEDTELESVNEIYEKMNKAFGKYFSVGIMHGKMKNDEKELVMKSFKDGVTNILVSTTVIEVGVDVPNATMIVIYDAYRFGLSTLHQLRGRVGRNSLQSTCILLSSKETTRLQILVETNDGFKVSEEDFKLRGSGDLFGVNQSGDMVFKIANVKRDFNILLKAKEDSLEYLSSNDSYIEQLNKVIDNLKEIS